MNYVFEVFGIGPADSDAVFALDCPGCASPVVETHPIPHVGEGEYRATIAEGAYVPGGSTAVGCITMLVLPWTLGFRAYIDEHDFAGGTVDDLVCWRFVEWGDGGYLDERIGPDWGCVDWPYETGGVE